LNPARSLIKIASAWFNGSFQRRFPSVYKEAGMEHSTPLQQLPAGLVFPEDLSDRIAFDPQRRQLTFRGFMTKYAHDQLNGLAKDEQYRTAVQRLFVLSSEEFAQPAARRTSPWLVASAAVGITAMTVLAAWTIRGTSLRDHHPPAASQLNPSGDNNHATSIAVVQPN
jgi:hypothetical protein